MSEAIVKSYLIDAGNSNDGPVGFCLRIRATSKQSALKLARAALPDMVELKRHCMGGNDVIYFNVYISPENLTEENILEEDEEDEDFDLLYDDEITDLEEENKCQKPETPPSEPPF